MFYLAYSKKAAQQGMLPGQMGPSSVAPVPSGAPLGQSGNDPMSALRSLASSGGPNPPPPTMVIPGQQQHMPGSQMGPILVTGGTAGTLTATTQQGVMSQGGLVPSSAGLVQSLPQQPGMNPLVVQQTRFLGVSGNMVSTPQLTGGPPAGLQSRPQQMLISPNVQMQRLRQPQVQPGPSPPMMQQTNQVGPQFQVPVSQSSQFQGQSPIPVSSQGPNPNQPAIPSPSQQLPPGLTVAQLGGSPVPGGGYMASPSGQVVQSPMAGFSGRTPGPAGAPSPGSTLNTPANVMAATPSPGNRALQEDQMYLDKLKQLQKYVDPLRRMIARIIDKDDDRKKELSRLKSLLDILTDPNKRCSMDTLLKCEQVLEKMDLKGKSGEGLLQPNIISSGLIKPQEQNICQPLLDAIANHIRSPLINHTLQRTFGPVVSALCGPSTRVVSPPPKRRIEEDTCEISDVLQGEIARLDQRFKVQLDPMQHSGSRTVHLICQLDDKNLPCVPPISITVPENYPDRPPKCDINEDEYDSTDFLKRIKKVFSSHVDSMPERTSVSSFLDTWEMSVRQACAPLPPILAIQ